MVKSVDRSAAIREVRLLEKSGGKSGDWRRDEGPARPAPTSPWPRRSAGRI
jgi:cyclic pyranopterin phosphate synthase